VVRVVVFLSAMVAAGCSSQPRTPTPTPDPAHRGFGTGRHSACPASAPTPRAVLCFV
jgi:hypothetical protein